jgi:hypothetical protein
MLKLAACTAYAFFPATNIPVGSVLRAGVTSMWKALLPGLGGGRLDGTSTIIPTAWKCKGELRRVGIVGRASRILDVGELCT